MSITERTPATRSAGAAETPKGMDESTRLRHLAAMAHGLPRHFERLAWNPSQIREHQKARLRELLGTAKTRSAWHARRLAHVDIDHFELDSLSELPAMTKAELQANWNDIITDKRFVLDEARAFAASLSDDAYFLGDTHILLSGGSTAEQGLLAFDFESWTEVYLAAVRTTMRELSASGPPRPRVAVSVAADRAFHMSYALSRTFTSPLMQIHRVPVTTALPEIVAQLNALRPEILQTFPSMLGLLAHEAKRGRLTIAPMRIASSAEPLLPEIRAAAEHTWGKVVRNLYGFTEAGPNVAHECSLGHGLHVAEDMVIIEAVDGAGRPVSPGQVASKIFATPLFNHLQPLIRYEVGDQLTFLEGPCPCGSQYKRIADVMGRSEDTFRFGDVSVHTITFVSEMSVQDNVLEYRVRQTTEGVFVEVVLGGPSQLQALSKRIEQRLRALGVNVAKVEVREVEGLDRQATGKLKRFLPLSP